MSRAALAGGLARGLFVLLMAASAVQAQAVPATTSAGTVDDHEARDLFKLGKQAFEEGRYERALKYFQDAYELSHRAMLLSNIGIVLDRLRRDTEALEAYKSYLEQVPAAPNREQIEERLRVIESAMQRSAAAPAVPTPAETAQAEVAREPAPNPVLQPSAESKPEKKSLTSRWWFWAGIGTVAAAAVVVGVAAASSGGTAAQGPALSDAMTRVREL